MRTGDLSELLDPSNPFYRRSVIVNDPTAGQPFYGNVIPREHLSRNGVALINSYPLPVAGFHQGTSNWIGSRPHYSDTRKDTVKIDYMMTDKHRLSFRGTHIPWVFDSPNEGSTFFLTAAYWERPNRTAALSLTSLHFRAN